MSRSTSMPGAISVSSKPCWVKVNTHRSWDLPGSSKGTNWKMLAIGMGIHIVNCSYVHTCNTCMYVYIYIMRLRRLPTSGLPYERATRALWWGGAPSRESFLDGIRVAHKRLQEHSPPPFWGYPKSEKSAVLAHFSDDFWLFEINKVL